MVAPTIKTLEIKTERVIRSILREVMRDITTIDDYDHAVHRINSVGWMRMHDSIVSNYNAGYIAGGLLVRRGLRTAAVSPMEDPRIAQRTTRLIYGLEQVADGQRNEIQAALRTQYDKGATAPQIADRMERFFDHDRVAASRFARTVTNDIYNAAHLDRYEDSGVVDGVQYSAHIDARTSDICRVLDGTIWALDDSGIQTPPSHFNCFVEGTRLEPTSDIVAAFRARYHGQVVKLTLSSGRRLTVTPNHLLLTTRGFLAAKFVRESDNIICRPTFEGGLCGMEPDGDNIHPTVEEIFSTLCISGGVRACSMPATPADFHNDGEFIEANINVITPKRFLRGATNAPFVEHSSKQTFSAGDIGLVDFSGSGDLASMLLSMAHATDRRMSGIRETSAFFGGRVAHPDIHRFTAVPRGDPDFIETINDNRTCNTEFPSDRPDGHLPIVQFAKSDEIDVSSFGRLKTKLLEPSVYRSGANPKMFRELLAIHAGSVEVQKIIDVDIVPCHGYVYDFQTLSTLCIGNSVITSNCRSRIIPYFGRIPGKRDYSKQFSPEMLARARKTQETFRSKYWVPMPRTKASATFQRRFLDNRDIMDVSRAMNLMKRRVRTQELKIKALESQMTKGLTMHELAINHSLAREMAEIHARILSKYKVTSSTELAMLIKRLKNVTDPTTIVESYGKSLMLDNIERRLVREAIEIEFATQMKAGKIIRADALKKILETI